MNSVGTAARRLDDNLVGATNGDRHLTACGHCGVVLADNDVNPTTIRPRVVATG